MLPPFFVKSAVVFDCPTFLVPQWFKILLSEFLADIDYKRQSRSEIDLRKPVLLLVAVMYDTQMNP